MAGHANSTIHPHTPGLRPNHYRNHFCRIAATGSGSVCHCRADPPFHRQQDSGKASCSAQKRPGLAAKPYRYDPSDLRRGRISRRVRAFTAGTLLTTAGVGIIGSLDAVGQEVVEGPSRPIEHVIRLLSGVSHASVIVQNQEAMFMNQSFVDGKKLDSLITLAAKQGIAISKFQTSFMNLEDSHGHDNSALIIAVQEDAKGVPKSPQDCTQPLPVTVDQAANTATGERIKLNGVEAVVEAIDDNNSSMNRIGVLMSQDALACITGIRDLPPYGAVFSPRYSARVRDLMLQVDLTGQAVIVDANQLTKMNDAFWARNAAAIFLIAKILTALGLGLGAIGLKQSQLHQYHSEISSMMADGNNENAIAVVESFRALSESLRGAVLGIIPALLLPIIFNMAVIGLDVETGLRNITLATMFMAIANGMAGRSGSLKVLKNMTPAEAMR